MCLLIQGQESVRNQNYVSGASSQPYIFWKVYLTSLCLSFILNKMGITDPASETDFEHGMTL